MELCRSLLRSEGECDYDYDYDNDNEPPPCNSNLGIEIEIGIAIEIESPTRDSRTHRSTPHIIRVLGARELG